MLPAVGWKGSRELKVQNMQVVVHESHRSSPCCMSLVGQQRVGLNTTTPKTKVGRRR